MNRREAQNASANSAGWQNRVVYLRRGGQTITSNPEGKPDHVRPARGTHPTGTGLQPITVHAICGVSCALARRCVYGLALASVETSDTMIAIMSDLLIGANVRDKSDLFFEGIPRSPSLRAA